MVVKRLLLRVFPTDRIDLCHGEVKIKAFHTRLGESLTSNRGEWRVLVASAEEPPVYIWNAGIALWLHMDTTTHNSGTRPLDGVLDQGFRYRTTRRCVENLLLVGSAPGWQL